MKMHLEYLPVDAVYPIRTVDVDCDKLSCV